MPLKKVKYNKHRHKKSPSITQGIIKSINFKDKLYLSMKQTPFNTPEYATIKTNLKTYNKILRHNIELAKRLYYTRKFNKSINDIKNHGKLSNESQIEWWQRNNYRVFL